MQYACHQARALYIILTVTAAVILQTVPINKASGAPSTSTKMDGKCEPTYASCLPSRGLEKPFSLSQQRQHGRRVLLQESFSDKPFFKNQNLS
jgi:hypothetical protein